MKICFISPFFEPWSIGGAEKYVNTLAHSFSKDHKVFVITSAGPSSRKSLHINSNLEIFEIRQKNINSLYSIATKNRPISKLRRYLWHFIDMFSFATYKKIISILNNEKPDIIHVNGFRGLSSLLFRALKKSKIPHVYTIHDYGVVYPWAEMLTDGKSNMAFTFLERLYIWYMRKITSSVTAVISPSNFLLNYVANLGFFKKSKKFVIPNGIKLRNNVKLKEGTSAEFIFLGRIDKNKGPQIAVEAFKKIKTKNIKLHIVGEGPYEDTIKKVAEADERIILHGYVDDETLKQLFTKCSYGIFPSLWYENFPYVINEFMNNGLPVIASNYGAIPELVKNGENGFLFTVGDSDSLCAVIEMVINDSEKLNILSQNAINSVQKFSLEKQIQRTLEIYNELLQ